MLFEMPLTFLRVSETVIFRTLAKDHLSWGSLGSPAAQCRCCETIHQPHGRRQEVQKLLFSSKSIISNGLLCLQKNMELLGYGIGAFSNPGHQWTIFWWLAGGNVWGDFRTFLWRG
jgi:hypothetical protein